MATIEQLVRQSQGRGEDPGLPAAPAEPANPILDAVKKYGPMAAVAAMAVPAIVLARGGLGKQMVGEIRQQVGPQMLDRLVSSPRVYTAEMLTPREFEQAAPFARIGAAITGHPKAMEKPFTKWLQEQMPGQQLPDSITRIVRETTAPADVTGHEASHAIGLERLRGKLYPHTPSYGSGWTGVHLSDVGGLHGDIAAEPSTHRMVVEGLKRWPSMEDFWANYREGTSPHVAYGELINEIWAQMQALKMGFKRTPAAEQPWFGTSQSMSAQFGKQRHQGEYQSLRQTGRLPEQTSDFVAGHPLMHGYRELMQALSDPTIHAAGPEAQKELQQSLKDWVRFFLGGK